MVHGAGGWLCRRLRRHRRPERALGGGQLLQVSAGRPRLHAAAAGASMPIGIPGALTAWGISQLSQCSMRTCWPSAWHAHQQFGCSHCKALSASCTLLLPLRCAALQHRPGPPLVLHRRHEQDGGLAGAGQQRGGSDRGTQPGVATCFSDWCIHSCQQSFLSPECSMHQPLRVVLVLRCAQR